MLMQFHRVSAVPAVLQPGACYVTRSGPHATLHFVSQDGLSVHTTTGGGGGGVTTPHNLMETVPNIAARDLLTPTVSGIVVVNDASADPDVSSGSATYFYNVADSTYLLTSSTSAPEWESSDW